MPFDERFEIQIAAHCGCRIQDAYILILAAEKLSVAQDPVSQSE